MIVNKDQLIATASQLVEQSVARSRRILPSVTELIAGVEEFKKAEIAPPCIVQNLFYMDVGQLFAPGGMGKTTLVLYEAICIALGIPLYGLTIYQSGRTLIITAEDQRGVLLARLREICLAMKLTPEQTQKVRESVIILDVSTMFIKLIEDTQVKGMIVSADTDAICEAYKDCNIKMVVIDPAISFGVSESKVNDNEQGLVMAARKMVKELQACVRYIHHTGKAGADKERSQTQYSGRGGSAFADGCRMVTGLSEASDNDIPSGVNQLGAGATFIRYTRHKLTYAARQPDIIVIRKGYEFSYSVVGGSNQHDKDQAIQRQLLNWIYHADRTKGLLITSKVIEDSYLGELKITRQQYRAAIGVLKSAGDVIDKPLPKDQVKGAKKEYLHAPHDSTSDKIISPFIAKLVGEISEKNGDFA